MLAKVYSRLSFARLCELLGLDAPTTEACLAELVSDKALYAKFDRPGGVVVFAGPRPSSDVLREWAADIDGVLGLLETTTHTIAKEAMVKGLSLVAPPVGRAAA